MSRSSASSRARLGAQPGIETCLHRAELCLRAHALPKSCRAPFPWLSYSSRLHWWFGTHSKKERHWGLRQVGATPRTSRDTTGSPPSVEWVNAARGKGAAASPWHGWKPAMTAGKEGLGKEGFIPHPGISYGLVPKTSAHPEGFLEDFCKLDTSWWWDTEVMSPCDKRPRCNTDLLGKD